MRDGAWTGRSGHLPPSLSFFLFFLSLSWCTLFWRNTPGLRSYRDRGFLFFSPLPKGSCCSTEQQQQKKKNPLKLIKIVTPEQGP